MKEVKIKLKINDFLIETKGNLDSNNLILNDNNIDYIFDLENLVLERKSYNFHSFLDFKNKELKYILKELKDPLYAKLDIKDLHLDKNTVIISYRINEESFNLFISYEEE